MEKTKVCKCCNKILSIDKFYKVFSHGKYRSKSICIKCDNINVKLYKLNRRDTNPKYVWAYNTLNGHKFKYSINITPNELYDYIKDKDHCEICSKELEWKSTKMINNSPTLDRIFNDDFISTNNIQLLCNKCNRTKSDRTMKEFVEYCQMVVDKYE